MEPKLTAAHQAIWNKLRTLPDGERMRGVDLQELAQVSERSFHQIIEDLRHAGILIGANRNDPKGYYELRTDNEFVHFLENKRKQLQKEARILDAMELAWIAAKTEKREGA